MNTTAPAGLPGRRATPRRPAARTGANAAQERVST
jgi:hypothetical protein